jgi:hypothetical protein
LRDSNIVLLGAFAADTIPRRVPSYPCCFVANTDPQDQPGKHWVACFIPSRNKLEFFDSYGMPAETYPALALPNAPTSSNVVCLQSLYSTACGHYCVYFLCSRAYELRSFDQICSAPLQIHRSIRDGKMRRFVSMLRARLPLCTPCETQCGSIQCCRSRSKQ